MSNILKRLSYLDFPECTREALLYLSRCLRKETGGIPGLGGGGEDYAVEVSRDFIHFACNPKRLTAIQELQLLEILCSYITDQKENERNSIFAIMFAGEAALLKVNLLTKLVSMAMSIKCTAVLDCTALWMQERGCDSEPVCCMAKSMVNDYCQLFPGVIPTFQALPSISPLFACNFIAAVTALFPCNTLDGMPPEKLVEHVTNWISLDSKLCSVSMRPASSGSSYRMFASHGCSPFPGLTNWCVKGPVLCLKATDNNKNCWGDVGAIACNNNNRLQQQQQLFSRLHLGVLQSLLANNAAAVVAAGTGRTAVSGLLGPNVPNATGHPFTPADIKKTSQELMDICKHYGLSPEEETCLCSVERLGQIIQVALASATLRVRPGITTLRDLATIANKQVTQIGKDTPSRKWFSCMKTIFLELHSSTKFTHRRLGEQNVRLIQATEKIKSVHMLT